MGDKLSRPPRGLAAWRRRYYSVNAGALVDRGASDLEMVRHALKKWSGLNRRVLKSFGLKREPGTDITSGSRGPRLVVNCVTCALCQAHPTCKGCPLVDVRNGFKCDQTRVGETRSPWNAFVRTGRTGPMLALLRRAERMLQRAQRKARK